MKKWLMRGSFPFLTHWSISVGLAVIATLFSGGFHHYDEQYHVLEYISLKLGWTTPNVLPWEHASRLRSWLLPGFFYAWAKGLLWIGISDPLNLAMSFRLLGALFNSAVLFALLSKFGKNAHRVVVLLSCYLWFFPYVHVRTSIDNWSGALFFLGLCARQSWLIGFLWGLAFQMRLQIAPMLLGALLWMIIYKRKPVAPLLLGSVSSFGIGLLVDNWGYGQWTMPWLNYIADQFRHARASHWGVAPPWYYLSESLLKGGPPVSMLLVAGIIVSWALFPRALWTWITCPFVLLHSIEPHKELRFLFPMLYAVPFQLGLVVSRLPLVLARNRIVTSLFWITNGVLLAGATLRPAESRARLFAFLRQYQGAVYFIEEDPYSLFKMPLNFYKPKNLVTIPIEVSQISGRARTEHLVIVSTRFGMGEPGLESQCRRVFSLLPLWMERHNYMDWIGRTRVWTVYECG